MAQIVKGDANCSHLSFGISLGLIPDQEIVRRMTNSDGTLLFGYATQFTMVGFDRSVPKNVYLFVCLFVCLIWSLATLIVLQTHMGTWAEISSKPKVTDYTRLGNREKNDQLQYDVCAQWNRNGHFTSECTILFCLQLQRTLD